MLLLSKENVNPALKELRKAYKRKSFKVVEVDLLTNDFSEAYDNSKEVFGFVNMELSDLDVDKPTTHKMKSSLCKRDDTYVLKIMTK